MGCAPKRPIESAAASRVTKTILDVDRVCTHYHILCRHRLGVGVPAGIFVAVEVISSLTRVSMRVDAVVESPASAQQEKSRGVTSWSHILLMKSRKLVMMLTQDFTSPVVVMLGHGSQHIFFFHNNK